MKAGSLEDKVIIDLIASLIPLWIQEILSKRGKEERKERKID